MSEFYRVFPEDQFEIVTYLTGSRGEESSLTSRGSNTGLIGSTDGEANRDSRVRHRGLSRSTANPLLPSKHSALAAVLVVLGKVFQLVSLQLDCHYVRDI